MEELKNKIKERFDKAKEWCKEHKEVLKTFGLIFSFLWVLRLLGTIDGLRDEVSDLSADNADLSIRNEIYEDLLKDSIQEYHEKHDTEVTKF